MNYEMIKTDFKQNYPRLNRLNAYLRGINGFIAGGCFRSIFEGGSPRDVDIFFRTEADFSLARDAYIGGEWKIIYESKSAAGFFKKGRLRVDLVRSIYGEPEEILSQLDFTVGKFAMDGEKVFYADTFWRDLYLKRLVCDDKIPMPIGTFERAQKYAGYGYFMCRETKAKLIAAIQSTERTDTENLSNSLYQGWD